MIIRKAENTEKDCNLVFALSNDPIVRENSFNTKPIEYFSHCEWFKRTLADEKVLFFLAFEEETFVGQIRFNRESAVAEKCVISLSITAQFRGRHIGLQFLELGISELRKNWQTVKAVTADVKAGNKASSKLFESAGFKEIDSEDFYTYRLDIR